VQSTVTIIITETKVTIVTELRASGSVALHALECEFRRQRTHLETMCTAVWIIPSNFFSLKHNFIIIIIIIIMALQSCGGPWPFSQFLDPIHIR
jgi:hypothetical protein